MTIIQHSDPFQPKKPTPTQLEKARRYWQFVNFVQAYNQAALAEFNARKTKTQE